MPDGAHFLIANDGSQMQNWQSGTGPITRFDVWHRVAHSWLIKSKLRHSFFRILTLWATSLWKKRHNAYIREVLQTYAREEFQAQFLRRVTNTSPHNFCNFVASFSCLCWTWVQGELRNNTLSYIKDGCVCRCVQPQCLYFFGGGMWLTVSNTKRTVDEAEEVYLEICQPSNEIQKFVPQRPHSPFVTFHLIPLVPMAFFICKLKTWTTAEAIQQLLRERYQDLVGESHFLYCCAQISLR